LSDARAHNPGLGRVCSTVEGGGHRDEGVGTVKAARDVMTGHHVALAELVTSDDDNIALHGMTQILGIRGRWFQWSTRLILVEDLELVMRNTAHTHTQRPGYVK